MIEGSPQTPFFMAEEFVTILRYRYVIEETVMKRSEFDKINKEPTDPDCGDCIYFLLGPVSDVEFVDWDWGGEYEFMPTQDGRMPEQNGYLVFKGNVTAFSDDCAYHFSNDWEHEFPLEVKSVDVYGSKDLKAA